MMRFGSLLLLLSLPGAVSHAGFWFFRMGCNSVPTPTKNVGDLAGEVMALWKIPGMLDQRKSNSEGFTLAFGKPGRKMDHTYQ